MMMVFNPLLSVNFSNAGASGSRDKFSLTAATSTTICRIDLKGLKWKMDNQYSSLKTFLVVLYIQKYIYVYIVVREFCVVI